MDKQERLMYTANGCMTFIVSMANQHHVPIEDLYESVALLCTLRANREKAADPERNK